MDAVSPGAEAGPEQLAVWRDKALEFLASSPDSKRPDVALKDLDTVTVSDAHSAQTTFLEAKVAVTLAQGKRPRMAQKPLYRLSQMRLAAEEGAQFGDFQDLLKQAKDRGHPMDGLFFFESFATLDHKQVWGDVTQAIKDVRTVIGEVFLNSGTLLGSVREGGFIAHDDDVDLAVILTADNERDAAKEWIAVYQKLQSKRLIKKPPQRNYGVFKLKSSSGVNIDVFPCWIEDGQVNIYPHTKGELRDADVLPLKICEATHCPIPANPEKMLEVNYGPGWREPDPGFSFPWREANRRFKLFRTILDADESAWVVQNGANS